MKKLRIQYLIGMGAVLAPLMYVGLIQLKLVIAHHHTPKPQAILTLGGNSARERFTVEFAKTRPNLSIWISSGSPAHAIVRAFKKAGASTTKLHLDYRATDTVTNFTTTIEEINASDIKHVYLITSDFHMKRAKVIAFFVLGSRGIAYTALSTPAQHKPEPAWKIPRDASRAVFWLCTGKTGASFEAYFDKQFGPYLHKIRKERRRKQHRAKKQTMIQTAQKRRLMQRYFN